VPLATTTLTRETVQATVIGFIRVSLGDDEVEVTPDTLLAGELRCDLADLADIGHKIAMRYKLQTQVDAQIGRLSRNPQDRNRLKVKHLVEFVLQNVPR
jgi:hypothetical protein